MFTTVRVVVDWLGRTTVEDDAQHAAKLGVRVLNWLLQTPWWVPASLTVVMAVALLYFLFQTSDGAPVESVLSEPAPPLPPAHDKINADLRRANESLANSNRLLREEIENRDREKAAPVASGPNIVHPPTVTQGPSPSFDPRGIYVGRMNIDASKLETERYLEFAVLCFNATGVVLDVERVQGSIAVTVNGQHQFDLPPPRLMPERGGARAKHHTEFMVVLEQRVRSDLFEMLVRDPSAVRFELGKLNVLAHETGRFEASARLPLWDAIYLYRTDQLQTGRVISAVANIRVTSAISAN
jgi:hypothetical protein